MTILDKIILRKQQETAQAKQKVSIKELEKAEGFARKPYVLKDFILDPRRTGIISEFKRRSPSKGLINDSADVAAVTKAYNNAGASAISVLTDADFFQGKSDDLIKARAVNDIPILRKDFIIDEYQILEAKAWGADVILLIAAVLTPQKVADFGKLAQSLNLNALLEVHNMAELEQSICAHLNAVGVNNRNLATFETNIQTSFDLVDHIPNDFLKISESAIGNPATIKDLRRAGFNGFLIGETFMQASDPGKALKDFVEKIKADDAQPNFINLSSG